MVQPHFSLFCHIFVWFSRPSFFRIVPNTQIPGSEPRTDETCMCLKCKHNTQPSIKEKILNKQYMCQSSFRVCVSAWWMLTRHRPDPTICKNVKQKPKQNPTSHSIESMCIVFVTAWMCCVCILLAGLGFVWQDKRTIVWKISLMAT